jgi:hypothetical protein
VAAAPRPARRPALLLLLVQATVPVKLVVVVAAAVAALAAAVLQEREGLVQSSGSRDVRNVGYGWQADVTNAEHYCAVHLWYATAN